MNYLRKLNLIITIFLIKSIEILVQIFFNIYFLIKRLIFLLKKIPQILIFQVLT